MATKICSLFKVMGYALNYGLFFIAWWFYAITMYMDSPCCQKILPGIFTVDSWLTTRMTTHTICKHMYTGFTIHQKCWLSIIHANFCYCYQYKRMLRYSTDTTVQTQIYTRMQAKYILLSREEYPHIENSSKHSVISS